MAIVSSHIIPHSQPSITQAEQDAVRRVLFSGMLSKGEITAELETKLAAYLNKKYALFTGNGTQAQMLILQALGIGTGDEVILPTYVCDKVLKGILAVGATPVLCDVNVEGIMDFNTISAKISDKTKAIILVHIFGINAWSAQLKSLNIPIVEDICQSLGSINPEDRTGIHTDFAFTSFHGTKSLAAGEGGMLFVNDDAILSKIISIKKEAGFYTSGTDLVAAVALSMCNSIEKNLKKRSEIAKRFNQELHPNLAHFMNSLASKSMNFRYIIRSEQNWDHIQAAYLEKGIHVRKGVDALIHRILNLPDAEFPGACAVFNSTVSIPILPQLQAEDVSHIILASNELQERGIL